MVYALVDKEGIRITLVDAPLVHMNYVDIDKPIIYGGDSDLRIISAGKYKVWRTSVFIETDERCRDPNSLSNRSRGHIYVHLKIKGRKPSDEEIFGIENIVN